MKVTVQHENVSHHDVQRSAGKERDTLSYLLGAGAILMGLYIGYVEIFLKHAQ